MLGVALLAPGPGRSGPPSSYSAGDGGLLALYRLLAQEGVPVGRRVGPGLPDAGTLLGAAGPAPVPAAAVAQLLGWVRSGHRAIVLGSVPALARALEVSTGTAALVGSRAHAELALPQLRGAPDVEMPGGVLFLLRGRGAAIYQRGGLAAALRLVEGRGVLDWFGSAGMWSNATLARYPSNVALAMDLLDRGEPVWFDEYWFGAARAQAALAHLGPVRRPLPLPRGWDLAAIALAAAAGVALWAEGWRRHPVRPAQQPAPSVLEGLRALAELRFRTAARGLRDER